MEVSSPLTWHLTTSRVFRCEAGTVYRDTSLIRKRPNLRTYSRPTPRALWWS